MNELRSNPYLGVAIGNNCYKVRLAIKSKGKGQRGGSRVITHLIIDKETVVLLNIYDKSDRKTLSDKEVLEHIAKIPK